MSIEPATKTESAETSDEQEPKRLRREGDLPTDLVCEDCGDTIQNQETCVGIVPGMNTLGEFNPLINPSIEVVCDDCMKDYGGGQ